MKKSTWIFAGLISITLALAYSFLSAQDQQDTAAGAFVVLQYSSEANSINVFNGGKGDIVRAKGRHINDALVDVLTKYKSEGYELVSAVSPTKIDNSARISSTSPILFILKKVN